MPIRPVSLLLVMIAAPLAGCPGFMVGDAADGSGGSGAAGRGSSSAACSPLDGIYQFTYQVRSGTCTARPAELIEFNSGQLTSSPTLSCQGGAAMTSACDFERDQVCSVSDAFTGGLLGMMHVSGTVSEVGDDTRVHGSWDIELADTSNQSCKGTYDVVGTRLQ